MNVQVLRGVIAQLVASPRDFLAGWMEGRHRFVLASCKDVIDASIFPRGSVHFAASQAAVAFYQALDDGGA